MPKRFCKGGKYLTFTYISHDIISWRRPAPFPTAFPPKHLWTLSGIYFYEFVIYLVCLLLARAARLLHFLTNAWWFLNLELSLRSYMLSGLSVILQTRWEEDIYASIFSVYTSSFRWGPGNILFDVWCWREYLCSIWTIPTIQSSFPYQRAVTWYYINVLVFDKILKHPAQGCLPLFCILDYLFITSCIYADLLDTNWCTDLRCSDELSHWLHQNGIHKCLLVPD